MVINRDGRLDPAAMLIQALLRRIFQFLCFIATVSMTCYCLGKYLRNEDMASISYHKFDGGGQELERIYPTITMCIYGQGIFKATKLKKKGVGSVKRYSDFLRGKKGKGNEFKKMVKIDFDAVSQR